MRAGDTPLCVSLHTFLHLEFPKTFFLFYLFFFPPGFLVLIQLTVTWNCRVKWSLKELLCLKSVWIPLMQVLRSTLAFSRWNSLHDAYSTKTFSLLFRIIFWFLWFLESKSKKCSLWEKTPKQLRNGSRASFLLDGGIKLVTLVMLPEFLSISILIVMGIYIIYIHTQIHIYAYTHLTHIYTVFPHRM